MSRARCVARVAAGLLVGLAGCDVADPRQAAGSESERQRERAREKPGGKEMKVVIGDRAFEVTLDDNPAAAGLRAMLPLALDMSELNGNEKFSRLSEPLPTDAEGPGTIRDGDLMLWGADTLVLFYKSFPTTSRYTRLGRIDDPGGLAAAVGSGDVKVAFEPE